MAGIKLTYERSLPISNLGVVLEGEGADREGGGEK